MRGPSRSRMLRPSGATCRLATEFLEPRRCLAVTLSVSLAEPVVIEGEAVAATLTLSEPLSTVERVFVTTRDGTATLGRDYFAPASQQVVFMPGQTTSRISIGTLRDQAVEGIETFTISATPVNNAIRPGSAMARITDFMPMPGVSVADVTVVEGKSGTTTTAEFLVTLANAYPKAITVSYATRDGTATVADNDYLAANGTITFAPGETSQIVGVTVVGDNQLEPDETFQLVLSAPVNAILRRSTATGTIVNDETDQPGFQIDLVFLTSQVGEVPAGVREIATQAADRWSRIIVGDLPSVTTANGIFIDDLRFEIQMGLLDGEANGPRGVLANAGPRQIRDDGEGLPITAQMGIDPFDAEITTATQRNFMLDVLIHEIGHGLGFVPGISVFNRFVDEEAELFIGQNATREYNTVFGRQGVGVPLQPGVLAHWDEATFTNELMTPELMTPIINQGENPLSRITVGALEDMGYQVNYAAADRYSPTPRARAELPNLPAAPRDQVAQLPPSIADSGPPPTLAPSPVIVPPASQSPTPSLWAFDPSSRRLPAPPWRAAGSGGTGPIPAAVQIGPTLAHMTPRQQAAMSTLFWRFAEAAAFDAASQTEASIIRSPAAKSQSSARTFSALAGV